MKVICDRAALLEAVNTVGSVVPTRSPSPALSCVKLTATKTGSVGALSLAGTDAEVSIALGLSKVDVVQAGVAVVSADRLRAIIGSIDEKDQTLTIELDGDVCHIKGTRSRFKLFAFPAADFPPLPDMQQVTGGPTPPRAVFNVPAGTLLRLINRTSFATARETSRYAINGVLFKRDGKKLEMVATDGRRLALCRASLKAAGEGTGVTSAIIPTKALGLLTRVAHDPEGNVRIAVTDNKAFFAFEDGEGKEKSPRAVVSTTLVEGAFPPYEDVIPKDQDKKITSAREDLVRAVRQAEILTNEESRGVRMSFNNKDKSAKLFSRSPEMGESEIELALSGYEGDNIEISFNPRFIADALKTVDEPEVLIELKAPNKPGLFKAGNDFVYVVMPVNLPS
ncbi:MAG TPA: DNA polymerase III subunit beta [Phycisphaerales bacterium]|nr:DNA polymerase III subunit beta [Phycisphaerales bacterium]